MGVSFTSLLIDIYTVMNIKLSVQKIGGSIAFFSLFLVFSTSVLGAGVYWDTNFAKVASISKNYDQVNESVVFYMSDISGFNKTNQTRSDCADIRVVDATNSTVLDYFIDVCNATDARVGFLSPAGSGSVAFVYWNYSSASAENKTMRFFFDDFNDNSIDYNNWNITWENYGDSNVYNCSWNEIDGVMKQTNSTNCYMDPLGTGDYRNRAMINGTNWIQEYIEYDSSTRTVGTYVGIVKFKLDSYPVSGYSYNFGLTGRLGPNEKGRGYTLSGYAAQDIPNGCINVGDCTFIHMGIAYDGVGYAANHTPFDWNESEWMYLKIRINGTSWEPNTIGVMGKGWNANDDEPSYWVVNQTPVVIGHVYGPFSLTCEGSGGQSPTCSYDDVQIWNNSFEPTVYAASSSITLGSAGSPPSISINSATYHRSFKEQGTNSYCGSNTVWYTTGSNTITAEIEIKNSSADHYLVVRHIKNSNSLTVKVNGNTIDTISSSTGSGCNGNTWSVERYEISSALLDDLSVTVLIEPSGSDDNYVDYIGLTYQSSSSLFGKSWDVLGFINVTDILYNAVHAVNNSVTNLLNSTSNLFLDFITSNSGSGTQSITYQANTTAGNNATESFNFTVDATSPSFSAINGTNVSIHFNESSVSSIFATTLTETNPFSVVCIVNGTELSTSNSSDLYFCTKSFSSAGLYEINFVGNDSVENSGGVTQFVNVSRTNMTSSISGLASGNMFSIPFENNATKQPENTGYNHSSRFDLNFSVDVATSWQLNEEFNYLIEVNNVTNVSVYNSSSGDVWSLYNSSLQKIYFNDTFNQSGSYNFTGNLTAGNVSTWWQNDATDPHKRYFRISTGFDYNTTLYSYITFYLPMSYDPSNYHSELWVCDSPSTSERFGCSGSWSKVAEGSGIITEYVNYTTTLSERLFFVDVFSSAQLPSAYGPASIGSVGGETGNYSSFFEEKPLPNLGGILLTPLFGLEYINPLTIGLTASGLIVLGKSFIKKKQKVFSKL